MMSGRKLTGMVIMGTILVAAVALFFSRVVVLPYEAVPLSSLEEADALGAVLAVPGLKDVPNVGAGEPRVLLIEFSDFQCPYCRVGAANMHEVMGAHGQVVRVWFVNTPLPFHDRAGDAARAALAAHRQGKFFAYAEQLFEHQDALDDASLSGYAADVGLDIVRFEDDRGGEAVAGALERDRRLAGLARVSGTPIFILNGRVIEGAKPPEAFAEVIEEEVRKVEAELARGVTLRDALKTIIVANAGEAFVKDILGW